MSRLGRAGWRILVGCLLLPLVVLVCLPFTETGSKFLLGRVGQMFAVDIEYDSGTLAGELALRRLAWRGDTVSLELLGLVVELAPACLWYSEICLEQLTARQLDIVLLPAPPDTGLPDARASDALLQFPIPIETSQLRLDHLHVQWQGGEWRQGRLQGAARLSGSTIAVQRALVQDTTLNLIGDGERADPIVLPDINLPLELLVEQAVLQGGTWDIDGVAGELDSLRLQGSWLHRKVQLGELRLSSPAVGEWSIAGEIEFSGQWPLALDTRSELPQLPGWPQVLQRALTLEAHGDLASLHVAAELAGPVALSVSGSLNALARDLPFQLLAEARWSDALDLSTLADVPDSLASIALRAPLKLAANGSVTKQVFQLEATADGLGYQPLDIRVAGAHEATRLIVEDVRLQNASGSNTLWGRGEVEYMNDVYWSAVLESSGLDLLPLADYGSGRLQGQMQLSGEFANEQWSMSLLDVDLDGTFNDLPVAISGFAAVDSQFRLLQSKLEATVNDSTVALEVSPDLTRPASLEIRVDELGRWQRELRGKLALQLSLARDWGDLAVTGSALDLGWQQLAAASGRISGNYSRSEDTFDLALELADLDMADLDLETARLVLSGDASAQVASLATRGDVDTRLDVAGAMAEDGSWLGQLAATTVQTREGNWYLDQAVALAFQTAPARLEVAAHCWQFQQSRVCPGAALLAEEGRASLAVDSDLVALASFLPDDLELTGFVAGEFAAAWKPGQSLQLDGNATGRDIRFTRHFGNGESGSVSWQKIEADIRNSSAGLKLAAGVYTDTVRVIDLDLLLPPEPDQPLAGTLVVDGLQLATLATFAPNMSVIAGELGGSLQLYGTVDKPLADGIMQLVEGRFVALGNPTELEKLELRLDALGDRFALTGQGSLGGGELAITGELLSQPEWRLALEIEGGRHEILLPPYTQMQVSEKLEVTINRGLLDLQGNVVVHEGELQHEQLPAGGVTLSSDVVEVDLAGNVIHERAAFDIGMRIGVLIEDKFKILGTMVNATVGGDLQLRQEPRQPLQVFGNLNVIGGELRAFQQRLRIQRGTVSFSGTPENPDMDVRAQREISAGNVTVGLELQGTLEKPRIEVYSDPVMSQGEAMSYLLRGRGVDSGAEADGVAMALTLGTGLVNQSALVTELNRIPGVNNLGFSAEGSTEQDTAATFGGYIGERLYLSYGMGIYEPINVLTARLYLRTRLWLEVVSRLENSVDLYYSFDIK